MKIEDIKSKTKNQFYTFQARDKQLPPEGDWFTWLLRCGRGWGKTRTGAEWLHYRAMQKDGRWMALIGKTPGDARDDCIQGPGGIKQNGDYGLEVDYEPSKRRLSWPNGSYATIYSGANPDQLRGFSGDTAWCDEMAAWEHPRQTWGNLLYGLREGEDPRIIITTTPRPIKVLREIEDKDSTVLTTGTSYENEANLSSRYYENVIEPAEGTTMGQQEIHAEYIEDKGLWSYDIIQHGDQSGPRQLERVVVAVDPAVTDEADSDETGIVAAGKKQSGDFVVLEDASLKASPSRWADVAVALYQEYQADKVVAEVNQGGDMVENVIRQTDQNVNYGEVRATRGKTIRAEPVVALYEKGRVVHAENFNELEAQMIRFSGEKTSDSPDRMDALVWAITELSESKKTNLTWGS